MIRKLTVVQRTGTIAITDGFCSSPMDSLDAHASMLPMNLKIDKALYQTATQLAALPNMHPLAKKYKSAVARRTKRHKSALHYMTQLYSIQSDEVETIPAVRRNPAEKTRKPFRLEIPGDKAVSAHLDNISTEVIRVYTDSSSHGRRVGALAVLTRQGKEDCVLRLCLGTSTQHTVLEAEMVGLLLGVHLIATEKRNHKSCALGLDNQGVIRALDSELTNPGHHILAEALRITTHLQKKCSNANYNLTIRWTAGHIGIKGNEKADQEAKRATDGHSSNAKDLPKYMRKKIKHNISALRQANNKKLKDAWKKDWNKSKRF